MKKLKNYMVILILMVAVAGCFPKGPEFYSDLDLVSTNYDQDFWNGQKPNTYFMPDSVGLIIDREDPDNNDTVIFNNNDLILDLIAQNMTNYGYQRLDTIDDNNIPDAIVLAQVITVRNTTVGWIPWYPWYGGGYYPWWPGYYPGYPGGTPVAYSYSTGTVIIDMIDAKSIDFEKAEYPIVWTAGINGLLRDSESSNASAITKLIDQAFSQSPYLSTN